MCKRLIKKWFVLTLSLALLSVSVSATYVYLNGTVNLSTSNGLTNYTNTLNSSAIDLNVGSKMINFTNLSYTNGELGVLIWGLTSINQLTNVANTSQFPFLNYSDNYTKNISSFYPSNLNITATFDVANCTELSVLNYTSNSTAYQDEINTTGFSCISSRATVYLEGVEEAHPLFSNIIKVIYGEVALSSWEYSVIYSLMFAMFHFSNNLNKSKRLYKTNETKKY